MSDKVSLPDGYHIVWSEEFNSNAINESVWSAETRAPGWYKGERQEYCGFKCLGIKDGCISISPKITTDSNGEMRYLSGRISTLFKKDFTYGKLIIRVRFHKANGALSYIRLMPTEGYDSEKDEYKEFPLHGQINVCEVSGSKTDEAFSGIAFGYPYTQRSGNFHRLNTDFAKDFHIFACEWDQDEIIFSCDGKEYYRTSYWFSRTGETEEPYPAPFNKSFHLVIGVAFPEDKSGPEAGTEDNDSKLLIDYVRLYQKPIYNRQVTRPARVLDLDTDGSGKVNRNNAFYIAEGDLSTNVSFMEDELIITPSYISGVSGETRLLQGGFTFREGEFYEFAFEGRADEARSIRCIFKSDDGNSEQITEPYVISLDCNWQKHRMVFEAPKDYESASIIFAINAVSKASIHIRNIILRRREGIKETRKLIAVCGVWDDSDNYSLFLRALQTEEINRDYIVSSFTFNVDNPDPVQTELELNFANLLLRMDLAAIIIFGEMIKSKDVIDRLAGIGHEKDIPVITFQHPVEGCINADFEYGTAFETIVKHVIEVHGAKKLDMFGGFRDNPFSEERIMIFKRVLKEHDIDPSEAHIYYGDFWEAPAFNVMNELLESSEYELPDAIICANDSMALGVIDALRKHEISIPGDVIVTGFDGIWQGQYNDPVLTTCELDYEQISANILSRIREWDKIKNKKEDSFFIPYRSMFMQSCGCRKSSEFPWSRIVDELAAENQDSFRHMLEMGRFVSRMTSSDNLDEAADNLQNSIWMWRSQYYFVGVTELDECCHAIFHGRENKYTFAQKFYRMIYPIPDYDIILSRSSNINVLLFKQIRSNTESFGYVINGYDSVTMRSEQRFEEFGHFINAAVNAVNNNRKLISTSRTNELLSEQDFLTGLYNRRGFFAVIKKLLNESSNSGRILSLFSIDMDKLKAINDTYGHENGDIAIQTLARAIMKYVRDNGIAARYGGDEFAFAIIGDKNLEGEIGKIRNEIEEAADSDPAMTGKPFKVYASLGVSERTIDSRISIEDMITEADSGMYADKMERKKERGI